MPESAELIDLRADLQAALSKLDRMLTEAAPPVARADIEHVQTLPRTKAIEWILDEAAGKSLRPVEIWAALQLLGRDDPKMEIQVTTFDLWQRGRIGKSGRGQYHSL